MVQGYTAAKKLSGICFGGLLLLQFSAFFCFKKKKKITSFHRSGLRENTPEKGYGLLIFFLFSSMLKSFPPRTQYNCEDDPLSPPVGEATQGGKSLLNPQFRPFFRCVFTAMLQGASVDRPRAPVAPSLSNTDPYMFSTEPVMFLF